MVDFKKLLRNYQQKITCRGVGLKNEIAVRCVVVIFMNV